ncbi:hypothetical protein ACFO0S_06970 [Chryseomicrobium palamuruense]|uniref:TVP38/TMEM64 family membrane protein n=1 Tax=Chryseomicrobium palamuruense TaxID=682973 RepID=A0ABV8UU54_9BACL
MSQEFLNWFQNMGIIPLFLIMIIEGLSIPFPGFFLFITYGHILSPSIEEIMVLAFGMSLTYTLFSFVPFWLGNKLKNKIKKRFERKVKLAQRWFH